MTTAVILIVIVLLVAAALAAFLVNRRKQEREALRERFGPEYDRAVEERGDRREAEHHLADVADRRDKAEIRELDRRSGSATRQAGPTVQAAFVDDPVTRDPRRRRPGRHGDARPRLPGGRRRRTAPTWWPPTTPSWPRTTEPRTRSAGAPTTPTTEELRQAFVHYRALFASCSPSRWPGVRRHPTARRERPRGRPRPSASEPSRPRRPDPHLPWGGCAPLVVGFDLDMTLIDTRPGIAAVWDALSAETGVAIDSRCRGGPARAAAGRGARGLVPRGGPGCRRRPVPRAVPVAGGRRRSPVLPGAREAVAAVRRHGGTVVVVTGKYEPNARLHLDHLGLDVDHVVGWLWGPEQGRGAGRARRDRLRR